MHSASSCLLHVFVSQKTHIKWSPNGIKTDRDFFGIYVNFGKWNQHETMLEGPMRHPVPHGHLVRWLLPFFRRKKANIREKIVFKVSIQSELRISGNIRNGERAESGTQKQRETERQIQSRRGSCPSHAMETMDQRGNPCPI